MSQASKLVAPVTGSCSQTWQFFLLFYFFAEIDSFLKFHSFISTKMEKEEEEEEKANYNRILFKTNCSSFHRILIDKKDQVPIL